MVVSLGIAGIGVSSGIVGTYIKFLNKLNVLENKSQKMNDDTTTTTTTTNNSTKDNQQDMFDSLEKKITKMERDNTIFQTQVRMALKITS